MQQAADCPAGEIGALLRREELCASHLASWRKQLKLHGEAGLARRKRGPAPKPTPVIHNPFARKPAIP